MEEYRASIANVDTALNRLNQTLASYKIFAAESQKNKSHDTVQRDTTTGKNLQDLDAAKLSSSAATLPQTPRAPSLPPLRKEVLDGILALRSSKTSPEKNVPGANHLDRLEEALDYVVEDPYSLPLYLFIAVQYLDLGYPDLAAGSAYKALLLADALDDDSEEFHEEASSSLKFTIQGQALEERIKIIRNAMDAGLEHASDADLDPALDVEIALWLKTHYRLIMYRLLTRSLLLCNCLRTAYAYIQQGLALYSADSHILEVKDDLYAEVAKLRGTATTEPLPNPNDLPDGGLVRREIYPWNDREPDRIAELEHINMLMNDVSDKLEVRAVDLPPLTGDASPVTQLGVFAKSDIAPGEVILDEKSLLTANNKLQDALCDACSADLPEVGSKEWAEAVVCAECDVVFCSDWCFENARDSYHPALCGKDVDAISKDVKPTEAADSLYSLLLLRALAMAETQEWHPLEILDVKYIWGDFTPTLAAHVPTYRDFKSPDSCLTPRMLPFSFEYNIRLPFHMLEKMDVDIFASPQYDVWVFNTLYAKFRGTASARLSGLGGRAIRGPEVSAVHPMWCLANHSCDPNVSWEWGGAMKFWAKTERVAWRGREGRHVKAQAGMRKDEEVLNHYCDIDLPVKERREWARGALGGDCQCPRCLYEAAEEAASSK
ncbi:hypothetical protein HII31_07313 [Pseudocercospora fuligena]|uniref:SET domain-containing protein n=1 Tax=Pseudocercospora fuligena TaxID=685502 RepID=A0A8H6VH39_9PEZI|nr:hypothetical protein HII31_07313 [Pseudocercospora fuligena]